MKFRFRQLNSLRDVQANFEQIEQPSFGTGILNAQGIYVGSGAPTMVVPDGKYYFRDDTPGIVNQRIYVRSGGIWTGIV